MSREVKDIPLEETSLARRMWLLFCIFFKIVVFAVGGGYVILPLVEQELVARRKWLKHSDFVDMTAVIQLVPGIIAGNASIYIGHRIAGWRGALAALTGAALPSIIIISFIGVFYNTVPPEVREVQWVQGAFTGIKAAVCGMVLATAIRMGRAVFTGVFEATLGGVAFITVLFTSLNPALMMVLSALVGICYYFLRRKRLAGEGEA